LPERYGAWNSVWLRFSRLSKAGVFEAFFAELTTLSKSAHLVQMFDSTGIRAHVSAAGGERNDAPLFETLLDLGKVKPRAVVADKGYDSKANREAARLRGVLPVIPYRSCNKDIPKTFGKKLYRGRARIEQAIGKLKRVKRIALRCEKTKRNFGSFVAIAAAFILAKAAHTA
jgi:transposase